MRAPLSIVIPTLNSADDLPDTLVCLMEGLETGLVRELIISDGGSQDTTSVIAQNIGAVFLSGEAGRGGQLSRGAGAASGDWLLFLHSDTHLENGWARVVADHIGTRQKAGYFRLRFRALGLAPVIVAGWANIRSRFGLPYGDQGLLISRRLYDNVGGYKKYPLMEDVALARSLRGRMIGLSCDAHTGAQKYEMHGWFRRGAGNLWTFLRYLFGVDPEILARNYRR